MYEIEYDQENEILEVKIIKEIGTDGIIEYYTELSDNDNLPKEIKTLIDCRGAKFNLMPSEIQLPMYALENALKKFDRITEAILVDQPYETVIATLFQEFISERNNYEFMVFCTEEAAREWLDSYH